MKCTTQKDLWIQKITGIELPRIYMHQVHLVNCEWIKELYLLCNMDTRLCYIAMFNEKNLDSPLYSSVREGPTHAPCFKATIKVGGRIFESPTFFTNLKEAELAAAKVALMSLASELNPTISLELCWA